MAHHTNKVSRILGIALLAGGAFAAGRLVLPGTALTPNADAAQPEHDMDDMGGMDAEMAAWMEAGTPGEHHEHLDMMAGSWKVTGWFQMDPHAPKTPVEGTDEAHWVLDGRYLYSEFKADMMGMPFEGISYMGYDNIKGQLQSIWMDSMSTGIWMDTGSMSDDGTKMVTYGSMTAPDGTVVHTRHVFTKNSDDQYTMAFFEAGPGQTDMPQTGELVYRRR